MIYDEPVFRFLADSYVGVEFGDDADLRQNFRVLALVQAFEDLNLPWVVDIVPTLREFGLVYDRSLANPGKVRDLIAEVLPTVQAAQEVRSRLFRLPVWYQDPWSLELNKKSGLPPSLEVVAKANEATVEETIERHSGTEYWVTCVGWAPGCYFAYPIDRAKGVTAPKLETARPYTPERTLAIGGLCTAALPIPGPSGYQMLGRLAAPIYEAEPRNRDFPPHGVLFHAGDRHRYVSVTPLEYEAVQEQVVRGRYEYDISEEMFSITELEAGGYVD